MSIGSTPTGKDIAGWVLKGDPKVYDLDADLESGESIDRWSVYDNYRKDLMVEGQRCMLWRSGPDGALVASGYVTGPVERDHADPSAWVDPAKAEEAEWFVPVELNALDEYIPRAEFKAHPVLSHAEFLTVKQMSNPTILTVEELASMEELLVGIETEPLPYFAIIGPRPKRIGVDWRETDQRFIVCEEQENEDFVEISDHDTAMGAVLAAAVAAAPQIDAEPVIDADEGGTLVGRLDTVDGRSIQIYKVKGGFETAEWAEEEDVAYESDIYPSLSALLRAHFEDGDTTSADSGSD